MKNTWNSLAKTRMKELGISQERLGELIGKTQGAVAHWLNDRREPGLDDIASIMRVLGIDKIDLLANGDIVADQGSVDMIGRPRDGLVPVKGEAVMGTDGEFEMCEELAGWLRIYSSDPDAFSLRVKGDSMFPRINSGEYVVVEPRTQVHPGDEVFIRTSNGKNMIKRLGYHRDGVYQFISVNQQHPPLTLDNVYVEKVFFVAAIVKSSRYIDSLSDLNLHG